MTEERIQPLSMQEMVDLIRIFTTDLDYEVRPDHIRDQIHRVKTKRKAPRSSERKDMRPGRG